MPTTIKIKNGSGAPTSSDLVQGELAIDLTNKRLYTEDGSANILELGTSPSTIDINAGTIDGVTLGTNSPVTSAVITTADINGGTIDGVTIGGASAGAGTFTTLTGSGDMNIDSGTLFVDVSENRVGIGTTSPASLLEVRGSTSIISRFRDSTNGIVDIKTTGSTNADPVQIDALNRSLTLAVNSTAHLCIDTSGRVGIGTTSPISQLSVVGANSGFEVNGDSGSSNARLLAYDRNASAYRQMDFNASQHTFQTSGTERMRITSAGNVGIGTSTINNANKLHIRMGSASLPSTSNQSVGLFENSSNSWVTIGAGNTSYAGILFSDSGSADIGQIRYYHNDNSLQFVTSNTERMRLDSSGNLGLGVTPSAWGSSYKSLEGSFGQSYFFSNVALETGITSNAFKASGGWTYKTTNPAFRYETGNIGHAWYTAPAGTAGNAITFTQAMTLDASGRLLVGGTNVFGNRASILGANAVTNSYGQLAVASTDALGADLGGQLSFVGVVNSAGGYNWLGSISGRKENATSGNYAGYLQLSTCTSGGTLTERMRIDSSGNLLVGTTSSSYSSANRTVLALGSGSSGSLIDFQVSGATSDGYIYFDGTNATIENSNAGYLRINTNGSERMRIDSSGNFFVGKTADSIATDGFQVLNDSYLGNTVNGNTCAYFNRRTSDGDIVEFRKDNTKVGSIGSTSTRLYIADDTVGLRFAGDANSISPWNGSTNADRDDAIDLGQSNIRFDDIYATNGTIQTSDRNEKQDIEELSEAEQRVAVAAKGLLRKFRWKSKVEEKGDDARIHFGIIAQDLQAAFESEGLDAGRYAMFIHSTWTDEETGEERSRMGVRYSELLAFIIAAI